MFTVGVKTQELPGAVAFGKQRTRRFTDAAKGPVRGGTSTLFHRFL
jgi:hypothetical protein